MKEASALSLHQVANNSFKTKSELRHILKHIVFIAVMSLCRRVVEY